MLEWEAVDGCEKEKEYIGRLFVDNTVRDDDEFRWGVVVDVLKNESYGETRDEPFFKYYNPKFYNGKKPSETNYEYTACKEFFGEGVDYEWREKIE